MRYFVVSSPVVNGGDLFIPKTADGIAEILRLVIKPIWNAYNFFAMYANADGITAQKSYTSQNLMDIYILSKLHIFVREFKEQMDAYNTQTACNLIEDFIDTLNNWYIRRNKERFWKSEHDADKQAAYDTLYTVLTIMCKAAAPLLPFTVEAIYKGLTSETSVHLADWPDVSAIESDENATFLKNMWVNMANYQVESMRVRDFQTLRLISMIYERNIHFKKNEYK
jgi:isoleucyl-tRNA synthetase